MTRCFCAKTPNRDKAENTCEGDFVDFEIFVKSQLLMCFKCTVKVLDQNLKPKWCNFRDFWPNWKLTQI